MRLLKKIPLLVFILNLMVLNLYAGGPGKVQNFINHKSWSFVENKGQLADEKGNLITDVKYYSHSGGAHIYCRLGMISFVFSKIENDENDNAQISEATGKSVGFPLSKGVGGFDPKKHLPSKISTSRSDLVLLNANRNATIYATDQQAYFENYYTAHEQSGQAGNSDPGLTTVHTFKTVIYKNVYPNIDLILNSREQGMEYSFLVHPGGKVDDIKLRWNGMDKSESLGNGSIKFSNPLGSLVESAPVSFSAGNKLPTAIVNKSGNFGFKVKNYDRKKDLLIDPTIEWSTYYGGSAYDGLNCISIDNSGYTYVGGMTESTNGIASSGAYQTSNSGTFNGFLCKFNSAGTPQWCTYFGNGAASIVALTTNSPGFVYVTGQAVKTGLATSGAYQTSFAGGSQDGDGYLARFTSDGKLSWATYFGGSADDATTAVVSDKKGNVCISGRTQSKSNIATSGAFQTSFVSPTIENFLAQFDSSGSIKWATYYGGDYNSESYSSAIDGLGNIYITGFSFATTGMATSGAYCSTNNPTYATAFLSKFSNSGNLIWGTYFGKAYATGYAVVANDSSSVYITGSYRGGHADSITTSGAYQTALGSLNYDDAFLAKFTSAGGLVWSTLFGGSDADDGKGITLDPLGNVIISGSTQSPNQIATPGAFQEKFGGVRDAFLASFDKNGKIKWATYFGGSYDDNAISVAADAAGNIYLPGITTSYNRIASSSKAYKSSFVGPTGDAFLAKFRIKPFKADAGIDSIVGPSGTLCQGTYPLKVFIRNYGSDTLKSATINWKVNGTAQSAYKWTGTLLPDSSKLITIINTFTYSGGTASIMAYTTFPNGSNDSTTFNDTTYHNLIINPNPLAITSNDTSICYGNSYNLGASTISGHQYQWTSNPSGFSSSNSNPTITPTKTLKYYLVEKILSTGCTKTDSVKITVTPKPVGKKYDSSTICQGSSATIGTSTLTGYTYLWKSTPSGISSTSSSATVKPGSTTTYYLQEKISATGCYTTDTVKINVNPAPSAGVGSNAYICSGDQAIIGTSSISGYTYSWASNPVGYSSTNSNDIVSPKTTTTYILSETISATSCALKDSITVQVNPLPKVVTGFSRAICFGKTVTLGSAPDKSYAYSWTSSPSGFSSSDAGVTVSPAGSTWYFLTETINATGCTANDSVLITVNSLPSAKVGLPKTVCAGNKDSVGAQAVSGYRYSWSSNPFGFSSSLSRPVIHPLLNTIYKLKVADTSTGCSATDSVKIKVNQAPSAIAGQDSTICSGISVPLGANSIAGHIYSWTSLPSGFFSNSSNPTVTPSANAIYYLTETINATGCSKSDSVKITVNPLPNAKAGGDKGLCPGTSLSIGDLPVSGNSYSWTSIPSGFTSTLSNPSINPTTNTTYYLTERIPATGCALTNTAKITINPNPTAAFTYKILCPGDSSVFTNKSTGASSSNWSFGDSKTSTLANPKHIYASTGSYNVGLKIANSYGCVDSISKNIIISSCVWPGDADNDLTVTMEDLLKIGIAFGTKGHPRPSASLSWSGQPAHDWDSSFSSGLNYKYADCNGDSIVDYNDTLAISTNFGLSHTKSSPLSQGSPTDPHFTIQYSKDTFYAGDTLKAMLFIGNGGIPVKGLYGLKFSISANPLLLETDKAILKLNTSFLGDPKKEMMGMKVYNPATGNIDIGITRIVHTNSSGLGNFATLNIPIKSNLPADYNLAKLSISNNLQISYKEKSIPLYFTTDSVLIKQHKSGIPNLKPESVANISIYPNPFQSTTTIQYNLLKASQIKIALFDITGKQVGEIINQAQVPGLYQTDINADKLHLSPGMYLLKFRLDDELITKQLIKF